MKRGGRIRTCVRKCVRSWGTRDEKLHCLTLRKRTASAAVEVEGGDVIVEGGRVSTWMLPPDVTVVAIPGFVEIETCEDELNNEPDNEDCGDFNDNEPIPIAIPVPFDRLVGGFELVPSSPNSTHSFVLTKQIRLVDKRWMFYLLGNES